MIVNAAKREANDRYDAKAYTRRTIKLKRDEDAALDAYCAASGRPRNGVVRSAIMHYIEHVPPDDKQADD